MTAIEGPDVARDMARAFSPLAGVRRPAQHGRAAGFASPGQTRRGRGAARLAFLAVLAVVIGMLGYAGLRLAAPDTPRYEPVPPPAALPVAPRAPVLAQPVMPTPPAPSPAVAAAPVDAFPNAEPARRDAGSPPRTVADAPRPRPTSRAALRDRGARNDVAGSEDRSARSRSATRRRPVSDASRCWEATDSDNCFYSRISDADQRLRRTYDRAVGSTLSVSALARVRRSWSRALSGSRSDPLDTITTLDRLTRSLSRDIDEASSGRHED